MRQNIVNQKHSVRILQIDKHSLQRFILCLISVTAAQHAGIANAHSAKCGVERVGGYTIHLCDCPCQEQGGDCSNEDVCGCRFYVGWHTDSSKLHRWGLHSESTYEAVEEYIAQVQERYPDDKDWQYPSDIYCSGCVYVKKNVPSNEQQRAQTRGMKLLGQSRTQLRSHLESLSEQLKGEVQSKGSRPLTEYAQKLSDALKRQAELQKLLSENVDGFWSRFNQVGSDLSTQLGRLERNGGTRLTDGEVVKGRVFVTSGQRLLPAEGVARDGKWEGEVKYYNNVGNLMGVITYQDGIRQRMESFHVLSDKIFKLYTYRSGQLESVTYYDFLGRVTGKTTKGNARPDELVGDPFDRVYGVEGPGAEAAN